MTPKAYPLVLFSLLFGTASGWGAKPYSSISGAPRIHTEVSFDDSYGVPVVEVVVGNNTYRFILDTGASLLCVSERLAERENLRQRRTSYRMKNTKATLTSVSVARLEVGDVVMRKQKAVVLESSNPIFRCIGVDGIIGGNVLRHFAVVFHTDRKSVTFTDDPARLPVGDWHRLSLKHGLPLVEVGYAGADGRHETVRAVFDSGNGTGEVIIPEPADFERMAAAGMIREPESGVGMPVRMIHGLGSSKRLWRGGISRMRLAGAELRGVPVMTGGMVFTILPFRLREAGEIVIDYPRKRYSFARNEHFRMWSTDRSPVIATVDDGEYIVSSVWNGELSKIVRPGYRVSMVGDTEVEIVSECDLPSLQQLIGDHATPENNTVTVIDRSGVQHVLPAELFLTAE